VPNIVVRASLLPAFVEPPETVPDPDPELDPSPPSREPNGLGVPTFTVTCGTPGSLR
jgi:hypothetical protein